MPNLNMILHTIIPFAAGAATYALGSTAARSILRRHRKHYLASKEYRNYQAMLRENNRARMAIIIREIDSPFSSPVLDSHGQI